MRILSLILIALCLPASASPQTAQRIMPESTVHFDGVDFARDGYLYFAGSWKGSGVFRAKPGGEFEAFASGFNGPTDTVMDSHGNLFVSNYNGTSISRVAAGQEPGPEGRKVTKFADTPQGPAGMAIDSKDNIFVTIFGLPNGDGRSIIKINPKGTVSTYLDDVALHGSVGLAIDDKDALFVTAGRDGRIFKSTKAGEMTLFSCLPLAFGRGGGAHLAWANNLLFATSGIGAVYRIEPSGALHYVMQHGQVKNEIGPPVSPLIEGSNGIAASPDGRSLFLGCGPGGVRALVRVDLPLAVFGITPQAGWAAFNAGDRAKADHIFTEISQAGQAPGGVWFGLGLLRFREKNYIEASAYFERSASEPSLTINAHYNSACALAMAGETDGAFQALGVAIEAGYSNKPDLIKDSDLQSLRGDTRWKQVLGRL